MLSSNRICGPTRFRKALNLIFPKLSLQNMHGFHHATILIPSFHGGGKERLAQWPSISDPKTKKMPGGYFQKNWVGMWSTLPETLTLFLTKICDFPYPMKPFRLLTDSLSMFLWTWRCTTFNSLLIILILLTNKTLY